MKRQQVHQIAFPNNLKLKDFNASTKYFKNLFARDYMFYIRKSLETIN